MAKSSPMTLDRNKRIRKRCDFLRIQRGGARSFGRFVIVAAKQDGNGSNGRIGITVPKKVGSAYIRNRVKRRIRHILRLNQHLFYERCLVIVARESAGAISFSELETDLMDTCRRMRSSPPIRVVRAHYINPKRKVASGDF
jgi:ribonuclease P protein component